MKKRLNLYIEENLMFPHSTLPMGEFAIGTNTLAYVVSRKYKILDVLRKNQEKFRAYGVKKLGIFGSFVRNEQNLRSDVDLLVEFLEGKKTFDNFIHLSFLLEELFENRVELVTTDSLSSYIGSHILKEVEYVIISS